MYELSAKLLAIALTDLLYCSSLLVGNRANMDVGS